MNFYYKLWVDCIIFHQKKYGVSNIAEWRFYSLLAMSGTMGLILLLLFFIIYSLLGMGIELPKLFSKGSNTNIIFAILFLALMIIINYQLIFSRNKYIELMSAYNAKEGKIFKLFFISTLGSVVALAWILYFYSRIKT